ncbi:MAG TPA: BON domain-containing protein [Steroidobacteraceae bacterium]|nr:BON domain-containing protein [Steroidobacteraceae bacterium]
MSRPVSALRSAWVGSGALLAALGGCATFGHCGLAGCPEDARITGEVRALYDENPALEAPSSISVQTVDGVVYLKGIVGTPYMRELAGSLALEAKGATRVANLIAVENSK